ncbi:NYN domain-containing protein [Spirulina subsalsa FACHB-351]|uniref:NYN domain-containing protein n=1 Tax=Spirulina subsalsa FACHB-351 TaxID=234711 RepID=A0ABT3L1U0_9CYAN|nr:NYN domain-containing protein [Spirulina subsalsa]MCW6035467.1 NYN domain-containing protein [Spirulina subsalsa FACHB-351]
MKPSTTRAFLLVDGYNIIGAWPTLKEVRDRDSLEASRQHLIEALINYSAFQGLEVQVVFDAHLQRTPAYREPHTDHLSVYYTNFEQTADTYIERTCATFRHTLEGFQRRLIVATSDRAQQQTAIGYGAEWMSALQLVNNLEQSHHQHRRQHRPQKKHQGRFLFHSLDPQAQQRLAQLRTGF